MGLIPMSSPDLTDREREAVAGVLNTPNLSQGSQIAAFEQAFRDLTGAKHAIGVSSGTAGLHLCMQAAKVEDGDLVITTPFSFVASANVILYERCTPVFVDVDPITGNIDPAQVEAAASDIMDDGDALYKWMPPNGGDWWAKLTTILTIDAFGQPADYDPIMQTAGKHGLNVIEDSCEALGSEYKGRPAGTLGDYGVFAFYPNKQITTGEGGMIVTDAGIHALEMRAKNNHGRKPTDTWLQHSYLGYNYRMDEMSAALGVVQMMRLEELITKREQVAEWYNERLADIPEIELPQVVPTTTRMSWFVYVIRVASNREAISESLAGRGIPTRAYFPPIHLQPYMVERFGYKEGMFPVTEDLGRRGLALPFSSIMTEGQVDQVAQEIKAVIMDIGSPPLAGMVKETT